YAACVSSGTIQFLGSLALGYSFLARGVPRGRPRVLWPPRSRCGRVLPAAGPEANPAMATSDRATEAVLGPATRLRGRIRGEGDVRICGTLEGDVDLNGNLTVAEGGAVRGETLAAHDVVVAGEVVANVHAEGSITIMAGATVRGRLRGRSVRVHEGARLSADFDAAFDLPAELLT
ncbi:MAG: polymer-forming cytoskeletal protein, partial [Polyangiaceae bacterium]|nr:polymer-forming cytoskeletal protein [Polyangiaceae bacterium]